MTQQMHASFQMISQWLAPVIVPISEELTKLEAQLQELQYKIKFQLKQEGLNYWREIEESTNPVIRSLFSEIKQLLALFSVMVPAAMFPSFSIWRPVRVT